MFEAGDVGDEVAEVAQAALAERARPTASGCMWMMSVPMATWTVSGIPSREAAAAMLSPLVLRVALAQVPADRLADARGRPRPRR